MDRRKFLTWTAGALTLAASSCNGAGGKAKFTPESPPPSAGPATRVILTGVTPKAGTTYEEKRSGPRPKVPQISLVVQGRRGFYKPALNSGHPYRLLPAPSP